MRHEWRDLKPSRWTQYVQHSGAFDRELTPEYVEELPGPPMQMPDFGGSRRHPLLNHAEIRGAEEVPPVTPIAPHIVGCSRDGDRRWKIGAHVPRTGRQTRWFSGGPQRRPPQSVVRPSLFAHIAQVCRSRSSEHLVNMKPRHRLAQVLEKASATAEHHRRQGDCQFVDDARVQVVLDHIRAAHDANIAT